MVATSLSAASAQEPVLATHVVQRGESLWSIAAKRLGDPFLWPALYRANRDQIKHPARVYPGQQLAVPELDEASRKAARREAGLTPSP